MNAHDILMYGDRTLMSGLDGLPRASWTEGGVCGWWSVKDVLAHLTSFEICHAELMASFIQPAPTPMLDQFREQRTEFNDVQVEAMKDRSPDDVLHAYRGAHEDLMQAVSQLPASTLAEVGTIPWYGEDYSLDDLLVYSNYGHKREHVAQITLFKDRRA
jgi:uncharacterized protein (TIGR03083 family)